MKEVKYKSQLNYKKKVAFKLLQMVIKNLSYALFLKIHKEKLFLLISLFQMKDLVKTL